MNALGTTPTEPRLCPLCDECLDMEMERDSGICANHMQDRSAVLNSWMAKWFPETARLVRP